MSGKVWTPMEVKALRKRLGLSQVKFAAALGVSFCSVNRWENDKTEPMRWAKRLLDELDK